MTETENPKPGPEMADPIIRGSLLQRDVGIASPPEYEGVPVSLVRIAEWLSEDEGVRISVQTLNNNIDKLLKKLQVELFKDPVIRGYLFDNGLDFVTRSDT